MTYQVLLFVVMWLSGEGFKLDNRFENRPECAKNGLSMYVNDRKVTFAAETILNPVLNWC